MVYAGIKAKFDKPLSRGSLPMTLKLEAHWLEIRQ